MVLWGGVEVSVKKITETKFLVRAKVVKNFEQFLDFYGVVVLAKKIAKNGQVMLKWKKMNAFEPGEVFSYPHDVSTTSRRLYSEYQRIFEF